MSAIDDKYAELGGPGGILGEPIGPEIVSPHDGVGHKRHFQKGSIFWHPSTGAHEVHGDIRKKYAHMGWESMVLGYPITDETATPDPNPSGRYNYFQHGCIYWHPNIGAHEIHDAILQKWASLGWEKSFLGFPTTDQIATPDPNPNGCYNHFQGGSIYWHPDVGAHEIHGAIRQKWASMGWERSFLGFPVTDETATPDPNPNGRYNFFQGGAIYCSPTTGPCEAHGAILDLWAANGWERVRYGFPITDETPMNPQDSGRFSRFQNGTIGWTPDTRTWADFYGTDPEGRFEAKITLYQHDDFKGNTRVYPISTERPIVFYQTLVADGLNDQVSSVQVADLPAHCSVYLYEHIYKGRWTRINGGPGIVQIASLGSHLNDCISSVYAVNHGLTSVLLTQTMLQSAAAGVLSGFAISGVSWSGPPSIFVLPERRLKIHINGNIAETWPDSYLHLDIYFRLYITGPTTIIAYYDGWYAEYGGSFAGYANDTINGRLHSYLDNPINQTTIVNTINQVFASQLGGLAAGAPLDINLRRLNFLPEGLEIVIADNDVGAIVTAAGISGVSTVRVPGQITTGSI
jgi:hypothetical protein